MRNLVRRMVNEELSRVMNERKRYARTRAMVENIVREELLHRINEAEKSKASQVQDALRDPSINLAGLARKIGGLSSNDDTRRSEISKIARGEWVPDNTIQNDILHTIASDTE